MITKKDISETIRAELNPVKQDIAKIRKDVSMIIGYFDKEYLDLRKRVEYIEKHLGITIPS